MFAVSGRSAWSVAVALSIAAAVGFGDRWPGLGPVEREPTLQSPAAVATAGPGAPAVAAAAAAGCRVAATTPLRQATVHTPGACRPSQPGGSFPPCPPAPASC